jgi:DNA-binding transcriptional LysR family regulator
MDLNKIDLNLLVVFNQLLIDRKVSLAAEHLGLTQPAVSNALKRLRLLLEDELFLRTSQGMEPTLYAQQLAEPVSYALSALHSALNQRTHFDPLSSQRTFSLAMTDIGEIYFMPMLMDALAEKAPKVTVSTVRNNAVSLREDLEAGAVDLAIGLLPHLQAGFFQRHLFQQRYVCVYRKDHPQVQAPLSLDAFCELEHLGIVSAHTGHGEVDSLLERSGIKRNIRLTVPHFTAVGHILQRTNLIATVPERLAVSLLEPFNLELSPHPVALPPIAIKLIWHGKYHRDPANRWLRRLIFELFSE